MFYTESSPAWISHNDDEIHHLGNPHARCTMLVIVKLSQRVVVIEGKDNRYGKLVNICMIHWPMATALGTWLSLSGAQ